MTEGDTTAGDTRSTRWLKEPLFHFIGLGALLFAGYGMLNGGGGEGRIVVDDQVVSELARRYASVWQRPPSQAELQGQIDAYVREEIFYRQGIALGLQDDDPIVRRRVEQKVRVIAEESGDSAPPSDAQLEVYLKAHKDRYETVPTVGLEQVYFDASGAEGAAEAQASVALAKLRAGADMSGVGSSSMLPATLEAAPLDLVARDFGSAFALGLKDLPRGVWAGPVRSGLGLHLVRITEWTPGRVATLDEARADVLRDYERDRRAAAVDAYYENLRKGYRVDVTARLPDVATPATSK